jgi:broad specificity phosphatase PhoE
MACIYFVTHPEVQVDPLVPVPDWRLSPRGVQRMQALLHQPWLRQINAVWCSTERKAVEAAEIIGAAIGIEPRSLTELGENDRSATGYLPKAEFEAVADAFFANPLASVRGWETATNAQRRITAAVATVQAAVPACCNIVVVSHGGVGTLLLCRLKACPISRTEDQPGEGGGNYFCFERESYSLQHGWMPIDSIRA